MVIDARIPEIFVAEAERRRALVAADIHARDRLVAEDLVHVQVNRAAHDKAALLRAANERKPSCRSLLSAALVLTAGPKANSSTLCAVHI
jgi:hypothetical protein